VIKTEPSAEAFLPTKKLVHAKADVMLKRKAEQRRIVFFILLKIFNE
jgi:hypothetical protein